jgi:CheY-like chemotaxis protein
MPEGGTINVFAENVASGRDEEMSLREGEYIRLSIKDQGVGIPKESLSKVFDPYFATRGMKGQEGMGLGLMTGYSAVKSHGGLITVESREGAGTTFHVYLPASRKEGPEDLSIGKGRILLMDDEGMVRKIAGALLRHIGYEVEVARDGEEAIDLFRQAKASQQPFDAIIQILPFGRRWKRDHRRLSRSIRK